jgi:hypothetical protein
MMTTLAEQFLALLFDAAFVRANLLRLSAMHAYIQQVPLRRFVQFSSRMIFSVNENPS